MASNGYKFWNRSEHLFFCLILLLVFRDRLMMYQFDWYVLGFVL